MLLLLLMLIFSRDPAEGFALAQGRPPSSQVSQAVFTS